jgi:hypothetical protein
MKIRKIIKIILQKNFIIHDGNCSSSKILILNTLLLVQAIILEYPKYK